MAAMTTFPVYDPWVKEPPQAEHLSELRQFNQRCYALVKKVYERNTEAGRKGKDLFRVVGILRADKTRHSTFNLAMPLAKYEIFPLDVGAVEYAGAMGSAETLLGGEYRIATLEEEAICAKEDVEAHNAVIARREKVAGQNIGAAFAGIANRFLGPVTPAPAGGKGK